MSEHKISVRELIEFLYSSGDIDNRYINRVRSKEGIYAHQQIQQSYKEDTRAEVAISYRKNFNGVYLTISGRIDGLEINKDGRVTIEEIKSTNKVLHDISSPLNIHLLQAKFYAFMYACEAGLDNISIRITYINTVDNGTKYYPYDFKAQQLEEEITEVILSYLDYLKKIAHIKQNKDNSILNLNFPYAYRPGQKNIIKNVYKTITEGKNLFLHAPTGSGKTLSVIFPSLKYTAQKDTKIFYLSSKGTQKNAAVDSLTILKDAGLSIKAVVIDAKEKVCQNYKVSCNPDDCTYAQKYYDNFKEVIIEMLSKNDIITRDILASYAREHNLCPFELSLDISRFCDMIICDYNYVFDPISSLKRYFEEDGEYIFLIDEAHNLSERGRGMYSAGINKTELSDARKNIKNIKSIYNALGKISSSFNKTAKCGDEAQIELSPKDEVFKSIKKFIEKCDAYASDNGKIPDEISQFYLNALRFHKIMILAGKTHIYYYDKSEKALKIYCLDASGYLRDTMSKSQGSILFSATLLPSEYFMRISGGSEDDYVMITKSPFDEKNLKVLSICDTDLTYKKRNASISQIIKYINAVTKNKKGNYIAFFPSFEFMKTVYRAYTEEYGTENILIQKPGMNEEQREEFILRFDKKDDVLLAFAVLGGSFAESIDLTGDKLIGCILISVGLPKVCYEREKLKEYFDNEGRGFDYAYLYEGMNKIMQAGGRVIRSEDDKGCIVLIDKRFCHSKYKQLTSNCWPQIKYVFDHDEFELLLQ